LDTIRQTECIKSEELLQRVQKTGIFYTQPNKGGVTVLVTSCVGTAVCNTLLKARWKEGNINSYWMNLRKAKDIVN
jgi:hypothetical protein